MLATFVVLLIEFSHGRTRITGFSAFGLCIFVPSIFILWISDCRFLRRILPRSRTLEYGCDTRAEQVITTCTRNTGTLLWMVLLSRCTLRWRLATGLGFLASRSLRPLPSPLSFARERAPSSSTIPKSSFHWCSRRLDPQRGSSRQHTRHPGPTCLCNLVGQFAE